jgi:hypothetical protein
LITIYFNKLNALKLQLKNYIELIQIAVKKHKFKA